MADLTLTSVTYQYKTATAPSVSNVNCVFTTGKMYAIVGPSGSGKSTLLSMLAGLDLPTGGEQQRVAIARSLAAGAKTLLADEPTGNLDEANTQNIMSILQKLAHEDDYCVIVVTHDLEAAAIADVIYRMRDGMLVS